MAPTRNNRGRLSTESNHSAQPRVVALKSPTRTPDRGSQKRIIGITEIQKQALIDNLQLEITERARKLRAQYALQAHSLRTRIELRVNRIPTSLRKANMGELFEKHQQLLQAKQRPTPDETQSSEPVKTREISQKPKKPNEMKYEATIQAKGTKRNSDAIDSADKENALGISHDIPNPKKRVKVVKAPSRQVTNPSTVLSPKSANFRNIPQSPFRPALGSPQKSFLSRPASPLKPIPPIKGGSPAKAAAATATLASFINEKPKVGRPKAGAARKTSTSKATVKKPARTKRGIQGAQEAEEIRKVSNTSNVSNGSTGTTIVNGRRKAPAAAVKRNDVGVRAVGKKVTVATDPPPAGRRVLRKRA